MVFARVSHKGESLWAASDDQRPFFFIQTPVGIPVSESVC